MSECEGKIVREYEHEESNTAVALEGRHGDGPGSDDDPCPFCAKLQPFTMFALSELVFDGQHKCRRLELLTDELFVEPSVDDMGQVARLIGRNDEAGLDAFLNALCKRRP